MNHGNVPRPLTLNEEARTFRPAVGVGRPLLPPPPAGAGRPVEGRPGDAQRRLLAAQHRGPLAGPAGAVRPLADRLPPVPRTPPDRSPGPAHRAAAVAAQRGRAD